MSDLIAILNVAGKSVVDVAVPMLIQSSVLIVALLILNLLLRRRIKAVIRYWIWLLVLVKLMLPPSLTAPTSLAYWAGAKLPSWPQQVQIAVRETPAIEPVVGPAERPHLARAPQKAQPLEYAAPAPGSSAPPPVEAHSPVAAAPAVPPAPDLTWRAMAFLAWLAVVVAMTLLLIQRAFFVRGLILQSEQPPQRMRDLLESCRRQMGVRTPVQLRLTSLAASPSVAGLTRPKILMPQPMLATLDSGQLKSILLHELAHVKRGDLWISLLQTLLQIVYFFHPLLWLTNLIVRRVREQAVDETVLAAMGDEAEDYPRTLLNVSRLTFGRPALSLRLLGVVESKRALTARIKHIASRPFPKTAKLGLAGLILITTVAAILLPMAKAEKNETRTRFTEAEISTALASLKVNPDDGTKRRVPYWRAGVDLDSLAEVPVQAERPAGMDISFTAELRNGRRIGDFVAVSLGTGRIEDVCGRRILSLRSDTIGAAAAELQERFVELTNSKAVMNGFHTDDLPTFFAVLSDGFVSPAAQLDRPADSAPNAQSLWLIRMTKAHTRDVEIELWRGVPPGDTTGDTGASPAHDNAETPSTRTIHGVVTDTLGRPRECVYVAPQGQRIWDGAMSDAHGRFTLQNVTPDQKIWMAYSQASQLNSIFRLSGKTLEQPFRVTLDLGEADITGRVVGADGKALPNRKVELVVTTAHGIRFPLDYRPTTDASGYYTYAAPCGKGVAVEATLVDTNEATSSYSTGPVKAPADHALIELPVLVAAEKKIQPDFDRNLGNDGTFHCRGRVVDNDGKPIRGVRVDLSYSMQSTRGYWSKSAMTDNQGRWHRGIPPECTNLAMEFEHPEYYIENDRIRPSRDELANGTHLATMKRGVVLRGRVVNEQGRPVENALVCADRFYSRTPSPYNQLIENSTTDRTRADGTFRIAGLPPGTRTITAHSSNHAPILHPVDIQADMAPITVTLAKGRTYRGRILNAKGRPIQDARIGVTGWRLGKEQRDMSRLAHTDAKGNFTLANLPEGQITVYIAKKPLMGFHKDLPEDLSSVDELVMYEVPVFTGRVVDEETGEALPEFSIANGVRWKRQDASVDWSRRRSTRRPDPNGLFTHRWGGYGISYPCSTLAYMKIQAPGYLPAVAPPLELGQKCEPLTIRLRRGDAITGTALTPDGSPASKAQIALVRPGEIAFIDRDQFSGQSFAYQAEIIQTADESGVFEIPPTPEQGLLVAVHKSGYAQVPSQEFVNGSDLTLTAWSRVEGVIDRSHVQETDLEIALYALQRNTDRNVPSIDWLLGQITPTGDTFAFDFLPAAPLAVGQIARYELNNGTYLSPEPGRTYPVVIGAQGQTVTGRIDCPSSLLKEKSIKLTDPRQTHAIAIQIDGAAALPSHISAIEEDSFKWLWRDKEHVYTHSQSVRKRFVPQVTDNGQFTFAGLAPGTYEFVVNIHAPLGENVSCGRGVLEGVAVSRFTVPKRTTDEPLRLPDTKIDRLTYPGVGEPAPLFEAKTFDDQTLCLTDLRGKVVLLDFWATWCSPCVAELPKMQALHETFADREDFAMIGLSLDWDAERARRLIEEKKLAWPQVCLGSMDESPVVRQYGIGGIPMTILIDAKGAILARGADAEALKKMIADALSEKR